LLFVYIWRCRTLHLADEILPQPIFACQFHLVADPFISPILYAVDVKERHLEGNDETMKLLIVDAMAHSRDSLVTYLHLQASLEVVGETGDANDAICLAQRHQPDVVIMDVNLPDEDGFTVTRRLRALDARPDVVLLTVHRRAQDLLQAQEAGAVA
jgi:CheY-like chemotaxis protein